MGCPICELHIENERLKAEARKANAEAAKCWIDEGADATRITIYGELRGEHHSRLLALLIEIEESRQEASALPASSEP